jgi:hypothetical protein
MLQGKQRWGRFLILSSGYFIVRHWARQHRLAV